MALSTSFTTLLTGSSTPFLASGDVVAFIDISDHTQSVNGSTVKGTLTQFFAQLPVPVAIASASATAFTVGLNGATNPAFAVDDSTALQVAGLKVTGAVTGGAVAVAVTDSGAAANLTLNAKGTGTIGFGSVSTGRVTITPVTTITGSLTLSAALVYGGVTLSNAVTGTGNMVLSAGPTFTGTVTTAALTASGLVTASAGLTVASGQTLTVTGATITGLTAASVATGTFPGVYTVTGALTLSSTLGAGATTITSASASALTVGRLGSTTPAFTVDASTAIQVAGLSVKGAATGGTVAIAVTDSGADANLIINAKGAGTIILATLSTGQVSIQSATVAIPGTLNIGGALSVASSVDISAATAGNVLFPATQNASGGATHLDDYQERTYTPVITFGGASVGITYNIQNGAYTKVGRLVTFSAQIRFTSKGSSTGVATISLPVASGATNRYGGSINPETAITFTAPLFLRIDASVSVAQLMNNSGGASVDLTDTAFTNTSNIIVSGFYFSAT